MHPVFNDVNAGLDALVESLDGHNPADITRVSAELSQAVLRLSQVHFPAGTEEQARLLINETLSQLESAAIRVNMLRAWTRQRIDRNQQFRGIRHRGMALTY